jgi:hypothetical protein
VITNTPITESYSTNLVQVAAQVTWITGGVERQRSMTTFVSRYGLQNYVY